MRKALLRICLLLACWPAIAHAALARWERGSVPLRLADRAAARASLAGNKAPVAVLDPVRLAEQVCPLEQRFFEDAADGQLDEFSLLEAALVASGVDDPEALAPYERQLAQLAGELRRSGKVTGSARRRARAIFEFMHRRALGGGYRIDCTDLRLAFDQGRFNCVSASVLFQCLAGEFALEVCGLEIPGHAMSRVLLEKGSLDVETTCPRWFRLMGNPAKQAQAVAATVGHVSSSDRAQAREVSPVEIAAMIYYNRGVDLLADKRFAEAAIANAKALRLDPKSATARGNLLATLNNWAIELGSADRHAEAVDLLRRGLALDPDYEAFALNYVHLHHQWVEHLCRQQRYAEALAVLDEAARELPESEYFRRAGQDVRRRRVQSGGR